MGLKNGGGRADGASSGKVQGEQGITGTGRRPRPPDMVIGRPAEDRFVARTRGSIASVSFETFEELLEHITQTWSIDWDRFARELLRTYIRSHVAADVLREVLAGLPASKKPEGPPNVEVPEGRQPPPIERRPK